MRLECGKLTYLGVQTIRVSNILERIRYIVVVYHTVAAVHHPGPWGKLDKSDERTSLLILVWFAILMNAEIIVMMNTK